MGKDIKYESDNIRLDDATGYIYYDNIHVATLEKNIPVNTDIDFYHYLTEGDVDAYSNGNSDGYDEGYDTGHDDGYDEGYNKGYDEGVKDTQESYASNNDENY